MIELLQNEHGTTLKLQAEGNAAQFALPFAKKVCSGHGYDIGANRIDWAFPGAMIIDPAFGSSYDANNLPVPKVDYIFSSHCLEHVDDWVTTLNYWVDHLRNDGTLFLYLPAFDSVYWRPWNNRKHKHVFTPEIIKSYLFAHKQLHKVYVSGVDLNNSFMAIASKIDL